MTVFDDVERPEGWTEILCGKSMAAWVRSHPEGWIEIYSNLFWISPELYVWWKLTWK